MILLKRWPVSMQGNSSNCLSPLCHQEGSKEPVEIIRRHKALCHSYPVHWVEGEHGQSSTWFSSNFVKTLSALFAPLAIRFLEAVCDQSLVMLVLTLLSEPILYY